MYETGYYTTGYYATGYYMQDLQPALDTVRFTWQGLVLEARYLIKDTSPLPVYLRWDDQTMVDTLNRGIEELKRVRPDAYYTLFGIFDGYTPEVVITGASAGQVNWNSEFLLERRFYSAILHYVVGMIYAGEDGSLPIAAEHLQLFREFALS